MTATPRETDEYRSFTVTGDDQVLTTNVEVCVVPYGDRPSSWTTAQVRDGKTTVHIAGLTRGDYDVYARPTFGDEKPVIYLGLLPIA